MTMVVEVKAGAWRTRGGKMVIVRRYKENAGWVGTDGNHRWDDGRYTTSVECSLDLVEYIGEEVPEPQPEPEPEPQPDAAEELAALSDDRDRWQTRGEAGRGQGCDVDAGMADCTTVRQRLQRGQQQADDAGTLQCGCDRPAAATDDSTDSVGEAQAQLEAAVHLPDLRSDLERVAAERDAAREEVRGLQVRSEQAEGDARQATAKISTPSGRGRADDVAA
jgi:hypothetical protein